MINIGYPCLINTVGGSAAKTFRLASLSEGRFVETVENNLDCLARILSFNKANGLAFFRISSQTIPFASHPACRYDWKKRFARELASLGRSIRESGTRISMHPDQFVLINAPTPRIVEASVAELVYHAELLAAMGLGADAKIQIHVGGLYGDRDAALARFAEAHARLPAAVRERLVVENDDRLFPLADVLRLHGTTGVPVLFDVFHHACLNGGETLRAALEAAAATWGARDGRPMIDYSSQQAGARRGRHADTIDLEDFRAFLAAARGMGLDVMLEIRDKEASAVKALAETGRRDAALRA